MTTNTNIPCPCGAKKAEIPVLYPLCCGLFHLKNKQASTPEQLMRSRYSAFVMQEYDYLIATHHPEFLNGLSAIDLSGPPHNHWLSLNVISSSTSGNNGQVEFQAWYKDDNGLDAIHERSDFEFYNNTWLYTQGQQFSPVYPKRNDKCVCGSAKKFKQCCLK